VLLAKRDELKENIETPCNLEEKKKKITGETVFLSRLNPRSLKKVRISTRPVYTKVSWLMSTFSADLPGFPVA
jgi:hypothetical protein